MWEVDLKFALNSTPGWMSLFIARDALSSPNAPVASRLGASPDVSLPFLAWGPNVIILV